MMVRWVMVFGLASGFVGEAAACSCLAPSIAKAWVDGADLMEIEIVDRRQEGRSRYFFAQVDAVYQGCGFPGEEVVLRTPVDGAMCGGLVHAPGEALLVEAWDSGMTYRGRRVLDFGLCSWIQFVEDITDDERAFLDGRLVTCPVTGEAVCADGAEPWFCFVDPCETAPDCPDGECVANYCGGCNHEYFDDLGYEVCPDL